MTVADVLTEINEPSKKEVASEAVRSHPAAQLYWEVSERVGDDGCKDIHFKVLSPNCPTNQQSLKNGIERTLSALRIIYPDSKNPKFDEAFSKLLGLAKAGMVGPNASPPIAEAALQSLQLEIVDREAGRVKNDYMIKLGGWALVFSAASMAFFFLAAKTNYMPEEIVQYRNFFILWSGCMIGAWCSFASRKVLITFFDLAQLEEDRIDPPLRLIFSGLLTCILGLVFVTGFADVVIGSFRAANIASDGTVALLAGALLGLSEKALPGAVLQRSDAFLKSDKQL